MSKLQDMARKDLMKNKMAEAFGGKVIKSNAILISNTISELEKEETQSNIESENKKDSRTKRDEELMLRYMQNREKLFNKFLRKFCKTKNGKLVTKEKYVDATSFSFAPYALEDLYKGRLISLKKYREIMDDFYFFCEENGLEVRFTTPIGYSKQFEKNGETVFI